MSLLSKILQWSLIAYKSKLLSMAFNDPVQSGPVIKYTIPIMISSLITVVTLDQLKFCKHVIQTHASVP